MSVPAAFVTNGWSDARTATPDPRPSRPCPTCWQQGLIVVHIHGRGDGWVPCETCKTGGRVLVERRAVPR